MEEVKPEVNMVLNLGEDFYGTIESFESSFIYDLPM